MDTPIERKPGITRKHLYVIGGIAFVIAVVLYFIFRDTTSSMTVEKERLTIATVNRGEFNDYIRVIGQVMPNRIIYMDAVEGGRVEERLKEEGAMVKAGDVILRLSNPLLNIGIILLFGKSIIFFCNKLLFYQATVLLITALFHQPIFI